MCRFGALIDTLTSSFIEHEASPAFCADLRVFPMAKFARFVTHFAHLGQQSARRLNDVRDTCLERARLFAVFGPNVEPEVIFAGGTLTGHVGTCLAAGAAGATLASRDDRDVGRTAIHTLIFEVESELISIALYAASASARRPITRQARCFTFHALAVLLIPIKRFRAPLHASVPRQVHARATLSALLRRSLALEAVFSALGADLVLREEIFWTRFHTRLAVQILEVRYLSLIALQTPTGGIRIAVSTRPVAVQTYIQVF